MGDFIIGTLVIAMGLSIIQHISGEDLSAIYWILVAILILLANKK